MKKLIYTLGLLGLSTVLFSACNDDEQENNWETYREWRETNKTWFAEQENLVDENGKRFYERVEPDWAGGDYILVHWFNNRAETENNIVPLLTSSVTTRYIGRLYDDTPVDSSYNLVNGVFTSPVGNLISGWQMLLQNMHVGDTVQVLIPYSLGYGANATGNVKPYSTLRFNMRLVDVPDYESKP